MSIRDFARCHGCGAGEIVVEIRGEFGITMQRCTNPSCRLGSWHPAQHDPSVTDTIKPDPPKKKRKHPEWATADLTGGAGTG